MLGDFLPIVAQIVNKLDKKLVVLFLPAFLGVVLESSVPAVAHFGIPPWHQLGQLTPLHLLIISQHFQSLILLLGPGCFLVAVACMNKVLGQKI